MDKWIKPLGLLAFIILVCSVLVRVLTIGETLSEYADTNPDIAYATPAPTPSASPMTEATAQPFGTPESSESIHYEEGFFYQPLTDDIIARITGISYPVSENEISPLVISYEDLRYLNVLYYDFNGEVQSGELICNQEIAHDLVEIFYELYRNEYQIEKIRLIDEYGGDDTASMLDNNTSFFN